jgi:hypothetical protein
MEVVEHGCSMASLSMGSTLLNAARGIDTISYNLPLGVCAGVAPFNFPAMIPLWMIPLSITLGNTFVLKPSERVRVLYSRFQARVYYWLSICKKLDFLKVCSTLQMEALTLLNRFALIKTLKPLVSSEEIMLVNTFTLKDPKYHI